MADIGTTDDHGVLAVSDVVTRVAVTATEVRCSAPSVAIVEAL